MGMELAKIIKALTIFYEIYILHLNSEQVILSILCTFLECSLTE